MTVALDDDFFGVLGPTVDEYESVGEDLEMTW